MRYNLLIATDLRVYTRIRLLVAFCCIFVLISTTYRYFANLAQMRVR